MTNKNLNEMVKDLKELEMMKKELEKEIEEKKDAIKQEMETRESEEVILQNYKVTYKLVTTRRFDSSAFKAADPETYARYCPVKSHMRLDIR